jgi:NodT family efflux transporter outer membrane factor (OMF) lipoprotein
MLPIEPSNRRRRKRALGFCLAGGLLLASTSGCATTLREWWHNGWKVGPNYRRPTAAVAPAWIDASDKHIDSSSIDDYAWWTALRDPTLDTLMGQAYRQNLDLRTAVARVLEARSQRGIAVANLFPQSQTAVATYAHAQLSQNLGLPLGDRLNLWATGFNASWELDFWGRYRRAIEASNADLDAAVEGYGNMVVTLLAEVATSYVQMRTFEQRLVFLEHNVEIQQGSYQLARNRFDAGTSNEVDVQQARSILLQTQSTIPTLRIGVRQAANQLSVLLGMPPTDLAAQLDRRPIPQTDATIAVGIPAELLSRRPDVRQAERQAASQSARIGVAAADMYPQFAINGFIGYTADDFTKLFQESSFTGVIFPTAQWNILNYGRIANAVRTQDARLQAAEWTYRQTVLQAAREVEDALVAFVQNTRRVQILEQSAQVADRSLKLITQQFDAGKSDFNRVYNAQAALVSAQDQLAQAEGDVAAALIAVYRSLGGGWQYIRCGQGLPPAGVPADAATTETPPERISRPKADGKTDAEADAKAQEDDAKAGKGTKADKDAEKPISDDLGRPPNLD